MGRQSLEPLLVQPLAVQRDLKRGRDHPIRINGDPAGILVVALVIGVIAVVVAPVISLGRAEIREADRQTEHYPDLEQISFAS